MRILFPLMAAVTLAATAIPQRSLPAAEPGNELKNGRSLYAGCMGCHSPDRNRTGPLHCGLFGRVSGTVSGYDYSAAMRDAGIVWDRETLDRFLAAPLKVLPGTTMGYAGIRDPLKRRQLIDWLATLDASSPLCADVTNVNGQE